MATRDVETFANRGQWVTRVVDEPEMSQSFSSRDEAVEAGERLAARLGTTHHVFPSKPEGAITDEDEASAPARGETSSPEAGPDALQLPPTTDDDGMPLDNPSG